jgi:putative membrane protein
MINAIKNLEESKAKIYIVVLSVVVAILVGVLNWGIEKRPEVLDENVLLLFPRFHALLNSIVAFLLMLGLYFIKNRQPEKHQKAMFGSFVVSAIFLVSYVVYHTLAEPTLYGGEGPIRMVYFFLLITHIVLAALIMPVILMTFYYAWTDKMDKHRKLAKITWPLWFYVAISGVIIYYMIEPYYGA